MISQFKRIKDANSEIKNNESVIGVRIDWGENATIFQTRQEKGAYYHNIHLSIHPVVIYTASTTYSVGAISDCTNHKVSAV